MRAGEQVELGELRGELLAIEPGKAVLAAAAYASRSRPIGCVVRVRHARLHRQRQ